MSISPTPTYHLCPVFHIAPPVKGHLDLGTILVDLSANGVNFPRNRGRPLVAVPYDQIYPKLSEDAYNSWRNDEGDTLADELWDVKGGVTRTMRQLRSLKGDIWGKVPAGVGGKLSWLCERSDNDVISVDRILTRYFIPSDEYMKAVFENPSAKPRKDARGRNLPLYMITGLMIAAGLSISKAKGKIARVGGGGSATDPSNGAGAGSSAEYTSQDTSSTQVERSSNIVLGFRVRKIYWEGESVQMTDDVVGRTLGQEDPVKTPNIFENMKVIDDFDIDEGSEKDIVVVEDLDGIGASNWVLA